MNLSNPHQAQAGSLTDEVFWDQYWQELILPREVTKGTSLYLDAITDVFDEWLPTGEGKRMLEIGGAPGQYGIYLHRRLGYRLHVLDNSAVGCAATRRNLDLLGIAGDVTQGDMFDPTLHLPSFDVVYSLGLIEHFNNLEDAVAAHVRFVRPGGLLILGCPNFLGVNGAVLRWLAPSVVATTNTDNMDLKKWAGFEKNLRLEPLFRGYVGGFEASVFARAERARWIDRAALRSVNALVWFLGHDEFRALRRLNSRMWSGYIMGVYRVSEVTGS